MKLKPELVKLQEKIIGRASVLSQPSEEDVRNMGWGSIIISFHLNSCGPDIPIIPATILYICHAQAQGMSFPVLQLPSSGSALVL